LFTWLIALSPACLQEAAAAASGAILHHLQAATQLTSLSLTRDSYEAFAACSSAMQALAGLSHLRSLRFSSWDFSVCPAPLFKALQGFSSLTSLTVGRVTGTSKLRYLPQVCLTKFDQACFCRILDVQTLFPC
jgi:hypothetical protein